MQNYRGWWRIGVGGDYLGVPEVDYQIFDRDNSIARYRDVGMYFSQYTHIHTYRHINAQYNN